MRFASRSWPTPRKRISQTELVYGSTSKRSLAVRNAHTTSTFVRLDRPRLRHPSRCATSQVTGQSLSLADTRHQQRDPIDSSLHRTLMASVSAAAQPSNSSSFICTAGPLPGNSLPRAFSSSLCRCRARSTAYNAGATSARRLQWCAYAKHRRIHPTERTWRYWVVQYTDLFACLITTRRC